MKRPLIVLAGCAALGCASGGALDRWHAGLLLALAALLATLATRARAGWAAAGLLASAVSVSAAAAAAEQAELRSNGLEAWLGEDAPPLEIEGLARRDGVVVDARGELTLDVDRVAGVVLSRPGGARLVVGGEAALPTVLEGDRVRLWASLRAPQGYATPGARDTVAAARRDGIVAFGYCKSALLVSVEGHGAGVLARGRDVARRRIAAFVPGAAEQGLVRAMLLGDRAGLDAATLERFRASGTYHVLALSGAQVALVGALLLAILRRLGAGPGLCGPVVAAAVGAYAAFVGGDPPIVRAAIMAGVLLLGRSAELDGDVVNLLGLAALVLLVRKPSEVADAGFQLSFVATLGLVVLTEPIRAALPALPLRVDVALAGSLAAQLALAPLLAVQFHRLAPAALVLNLLAVPLSTGVLLSGAALVVGAGAWPALGPGLGRVAAWMAEGLLASGRAVELVPGLDVRVPDPVAPVLAVHAVGVVLLASGRRRLGGALSAVAVAGLLWGGPAPRGDGRLEVAVLDVGQGDAIVLRSPQGRHLVVDAGGSFDARFDVGESVVAPFLWQRRVRSIDALALSHAHPDHVGGAASLARGFRVGEIWEGPAPRGDRTYAQLAAALRDAGTTRLSLGSGACFDWDGVRIDILGPVPPARAPLRTRNDDSLVLRARFGDFAILLTGDVEAAGESSLRTGAVNVLKVAHHGSRTSTTEAILARARPELAVVSVGRRNPFGHPAPEVLRRLARHGARVFRTDLDGTVRIETDGTQVRVRSERSRRDENLRAVMQLRASDDVLPSGTCRRF